MKHDPLPDNQNGNKEEYFLVEKKGEVDKKNNRDEVNLTINKPTRKFNSGFSCHLLFFSGLPDC